MGDGFIQFKKKYLFDALVKSLLTGFASSMLVVAAFLTAIYLGVFNFRLLFAVLIGVLVGLVFGLCSFFIFKLSDKRLARRLDKDLGLNEKIQTMHAFYGESGEITDLQRADAQNALDLAPKSIAPFVKGWIAYIVLFALTLAFLITSVVLTVTKEEAVVPEPDTGDEIEKPVEEPKEEFEATDHHKIALEALIKEVQASQLQDDAKQAVVAELTLLLASLDELKYEEDMKEYVIKVIKNVRGIVNTVNTTFKLHMYAGKSSDANMARLSLALYSLDLANIESELASIRADLYVKGESRSKIESLCIELGAVLNNSGIAETDPLYEAIDSLHNVLQSIVDNPDYSDANVVQKLDDAFGKSAKDSFKAFIPQQKINEDVKVMVVNELMRIFGITEEDLAEKKDEDAPPETEEPEDRPEIGDDGGFGTGETVFGSNDIVIDPEADPGNDINSINVEYGTIISRYDAKITEMIAKGEISEELAEILNQYFEALITPKDN